MIARGCNALNPLQGIATSVVQQGLLAAPPLNRLQRTQSPSGDCNAKLSYSRLNALSPSGDCNSGQASLQRTQSPSGDCNVLKPIPVATSSSDSRCNALNPLQGIATPSQARRSHATTSYGSSLQRTQSPSGDCNDLSRLRDGAALRKLVATHSIPFRGLQRPARPVAESEERLQRTQSPSGDCNGSGPVCNALNPLQGIATSRACNALNPLQGIATGAPDRQALQRTQSPSGDCNLSSIPAAGLDALNPLQGIATPRPTPQDTRCNALNPLQGIATRILKLASIGTPFQQDLPNIRLQRTQSPSGDCNIAGEAVDISSRNRIVATLSIPFRGLQHAGNAPTVPSPPLPGQSQRLQSPSGDCNAGGVLRRSQEPRGHRSQGIASFSAMTPCYPSLSVPLVQSPLPVAPTPNPRGGLRSRKRPSPRHASRPVATTHAPSAGRERVSTPCPQGRHRDPHPPVHDPALASTAHLRSS
jgi:hypothetical protein